MALDVNPIELQNGEGFFYNCRITAIVWTGPTSAGDTCLVQKAVTAETAWRARAADAHTYVGLAFTYAIPCPHGFFVTCPADTYVLAYIREQ
jgi:hypothetical protein